jgi:PAS domain S-box-containing protein
MLDMRTIIFSYVITDIVCLVVIVLLWRQTRNRVAGTIFWVFNFAFQLSALFMIILRGQIPAWMSYVLANTMVMAGAILGYIGLQRFVGKKRSQYYNYILLLVAFAFVHAYFTFVQPDQAIRNLNASVGLLIVCFPCAWLLLYTVESGMRRLTRGVGIVFGLYCLVSMIRIVEYFIKAHSTIDYLQSGTFEQFVLISNQMLFILLTYSLALMFNSRLLVEVEMGEEKFSKAFHSSPYAITITRMSDGQIIEVNESFFKITGYQLADVKENTTIGMHLWDRAEDRALVVSELASKGKMQEREFQFRKKSGGVITGLFSAEIIKINNENCVLSSINDVSDRKRMDEIMRETNQQLRLITDNVRDTIWLMDIDMRTTWISPSVVRTRGYTLAELVEMPMDRHLVPGSLARMMELSTVHLTPERLADPGSEIIVSEELEYYRKDGATFWADTVVTLLRDKDGRPSGFLGVGRDITNSKKAEEALKESERQYRNLFENSMEGIFQSSPEGKLISANLALARMFGYESSEEIIGAVRDIASQLYANSDERGKAVNILRETGYLKDFECKMRRKDDTIFWAVINGRFNEKQDGMSCLEGFIIDITDRKRVEADILRLNDQLEQQVVKRTRDLRQSQLALLSIVEDLNISNKKIAETNQTLDATNKEIESFSYSVSHDLRAPLRSIDGFSQVLLEDYQQKLDDTGRNYLQRIRNATQHMGQLIDDMLKLSRVNRSELIRESVDLSKMFREIAKISQKNDPARIVDVIIQKDIIINGDRHLLEIVLTNLIDNAWKFTGKTKNARVELGSLLTNGKPVMFIRDNGVGFDMTYLGKLFGTFQRLHTKDEFKGTGIGLATVKRIITRHGGEIWAEGEVGCGATFYFTLP